MRNRGAWIAPRAEKPEDASGYAYRHFSSPGASLMRVPYGVAARLPAAKTLYDTATAVEPAREEEWKENRAFYAYCQTVTLASVTVALPEALKADRYPPGCP